jgi:hypothetical protein
VPAAAEARHVAEVARLARAGRRAVEHARVGQGRLQGRAGRALKQGSTTRPGLAWPGLAWPGLVSRRPPEAGPPAAAQHLTRCTGGARGAAAGGAPQPSPHLQAHHRHRGLGGLVGVLLQEAGVGARVWRRWRGGGSTGRRQGSAIRKRSSRASAAVLDQQPRGGDLYKARRHAAARSTLSRLREGRQPARLAAGARPP